MTQSKRWTLGAAFLSGALLLASCGGGETPAPQQPEPTSGDARVIMGQIKPKQDAPASVNQDLPTAVNVEALRQSNVPALRDLQAAVDSEGRFTLTLPDAATMNQFEDLQGAGEAFGCFDAAAVTAPKGNQFFVVRYVHGVNNGRDYFNKTDSGAANEASVKRVRVFAKQDAHVNITPTDTCRISADLNLKAGWNVVEENIGAGDNAVTSYKATDLPSGNVVFRDTKLFAGSVNKS